MQPMNEIVIKHLQLLKTELGGIIEILLILLPWPSQIVFYLRDSLFQTHVPLLHYQVHMQVVLAIVLIEEEPVIVGCIHGDVDAVLNDLVHYDFIHYLILCIDVAFLNSHYLETHAVNGPVWQLALTCEDTAECPFSFVILRV